MASDQEELKRIVEPTLQKKLFVVISTLTASKEEIDAHLLEHVKFMADLSDKGVLFGTGPFPEQGFELKDGLTILQTATYEQAEEIIRSEPTILHGLRTYELRPWELREGKWNVTLDLSHSKFSIEKAQ